MLYRILYVSEGILRGVLRGFEEKGEDEKISANCNKLLNLLDVIGNASGRSVGLTWFCIVLSSN